MQKMTPSTPSPRRRISDFIRQFNKHFLNKLTIWLAKRRLGPFSLLVHRGRRSGFIYQTPILATYVNHWIFIPLSYGDHVDWLQNIIAHGGCQVIHNGKENTAINPEILAGETALPYLPEPRRSTFARFRIEKFLRLELDGGMKE